MITESTFAELIRDYVLADPELPAGMDQYQHLIHTGTSEVEFPAFVYLVSWGDSPNPRRRVVNISVGLLTVRALDGMGSILPGTAIFYMEAIRARLSNGVAFEMWMSTQSDARRTGWRMLRGLKAGASNTVLSEDSSRCDYTQDASMIVMI